MKARKTLLIRADASVLMGTGHVMRMIALAQAWQDLGGEAVFLCAEITPSLESRLKEEGFLLEKIQASPGGCEDLEASCAAVSRYCSDSIPVALDGYQFDADFQLGVKKAGCRLLVVDDYGHADSYHADVVLNQNVSAREDLYARSENGATLLLGPRFALLRREFADQRGWVRTIPDEAKRLLVTLGGADADNVTMTIVEALEDSGLEVKVVVGGSNPHLRDVRRAAKVATGGETRVELVVNVSDMPSLMRWADIAVAAGGSTASELACAGLPSLFIILADNQQENVRELEKRGLGLNLGNHKSLNVDLLRRNIRYIASSCELRTRFSSRGQELVDGKGAVRVSKCLDFECHPSATDQ